MKNKYYVMMALIMTVIVTLLFSYAYFATSQNITNNLALNLTIEDGLSANFNVNGDDNLTVNILGENMLGDTVGKASRTGSSKMEIKLESPMDTTCSYKLYWKWAGDTKDYYIKTVSEEKEFTIKGTDGTNSFVEAQVPNYGSTLLIGTYSISVSNGETIQNWQFNASFYNINAIQDAHADKSYKGSISVTDVVCEKTGTTNNNLSNTVVASAGVKIYISSQDGTDYTIQEETYTSANGAVAYGGLFAPAYINLLDTQSSEIKSTGIRYAGKDPDNYVIFNDESWRIIGSFDGADIGLEEGSRYTKIVRSEALGQYQWNSSGINDWSNSSLKAYLNGDYLESMSKMAQEMIETNATWHLRGTSSYTNLNSLELYKNEISSGKPGYQNGTQYEASAEVKAAIGLMYPSDYGYAIYGGSCLNINTTTSSKFNECLGYNWLNNINESLITPYPNASGKMFMINNNLFYGNVIDRLTIRPTLYLKSDVYITRGDGSKENPYRIFYGDTPLSETVLAKEQDINNYTDYSAADGSVYRIVDENGVRYEGANPDNYVTFNNELWRIIGVFDGSDIKLEEGKQYAKIIRHSVLSKNFYWDWEDLNGDGIKDEGEYENDWVNATLNTYLNGEYLNSLANKDMIAKYNNEYSTWHLRTPKTLFDKTTQKFYEYERTLGYAGYRNGVQYGAEAETKAAIGLMYVSDHGYALYAGKENTTCVNTMVIYSNYRNCYQYDWINKAGFVEWTIGHHHNENEVIAITSYASLANHRVYGGDSVRPTLYLDHNVKVTSGDGSRDNPYQLSL